MRRYPRMRNLRSTLLKAASIVLVGAAGLGSSGCVYPGPGGGITIGPPPLPSVNVDVNTYGEPAGYYYRDNPVYVYRGRTVYYYQNRRYPYRYRSNAPYYMRNNYRYYY